MSSDQKSSGEEHLHGPDRQTRGLNGFCVTSLIMGIIGLPTSCLLITPLLGIILGLIGLKQVPNDGGGGGRWMAIAGILCGMTGTGVAIYMYAIR